MVVLLSCTRGGRRQSLCWPISRQNTIFLLQHTLDFDEMKSNGMQNALKTTKLNQTREHTVLTHAAADDVIHTIRVYK